MNNWIVYKHTNKSNGKVYIGISSKSAEERWRNGEGYYSQEYFYNAIKKYGWDGFEHEVLLQNLSEEEARAKEIELIAFYKSNYRRWSNPTYGYNATDGGEGLSGWGKPVVQYDLQGNLIKKWYSINEAAEATNIACSNISHNCRGFSQRAGEFMWRYCDFDEIPATSIVNYYQLTKTSNPLEEIKQKEERQKKAVAEKIIIQYSLYGEKIREWSSIKEASQALNITDAGICYALRGVKNSAGGYVWKYKGEKSKLFKNTITKIVQYTKNGEFVNSFLTATEAEQKTGINNSHISAVCRGQRKSAGGYIWKKIEEKLD